MAYKTNVLKNGPYRPVQPIGSLIGHKTGPIQCKKPFLIEPAVETDEPAVEPAGSHNFFLFFKLKRCRFDAFYIETMLFYLELESL